MEYRKLYIESIINELIDNCSRSGEIDDVVKCFEERMKLDENEELIVILNECLKYIDYDFTCDYLSDVLQELNKDEVKFILDRLKQTELYKASNTQ